MHFWCSFLLALALCPAMAPAAPAAPPASVPSLDAAFDRLYNHDFEGSQKLLAAYKRQHAEDPLGYAVQGAAFLYAELSRLNVLSKEVLTDDQRITEQKQLKPDPQTRERFFAATAEARRRGLLALAKDPQNRNALLALCLTAGVERDFTALVEKRLRVSLNYARDAQSYAVRLLKVDPTAYDAYLTTGFSEYLLGSVPFFVKWFVKFDEVEGSKRKGLQDLELVARSGHYMKPFAQILLAMFYLREKRPQDSERLLVELSQKYPENPMIRRELERLSTQLRKAEEGRISAGGGI